MKLMAADMENKHMDTTFKQGLHRWEPWKIVVAAFLAGAACMGASLALLSYLSR